MSEINFIPEQYRRRQCRRRRLTRQVTLLALAIVCLAGWAIFQHRQTVQQRDYARSLEAQVEAERGRLKQLKKLNQRHQQLTHQVRLQQRMAQPLSHTRILATLAELLPDSVAMTNLEMMTQRPSPQHEDEASEKSSALAIASRAAPKRIHMRFQALAPDDMTVANLVATLSEHAIFSDVSMRHSRTVKVRGKPLSQFRLELRINLQRRFELTPNQAKHHKQREPANAAG